MSGFFSDPIVSLLEQYCDLNVEINHFVTAIILFNAIASSSDLSAPSVSNKKLGSISKSGCSLQYCEYSDNEVGDKMNGGAVNEDKSPLNEAIDLRNDVHELDWVAFDMVLILFGFFTV